MTPVENVAHARRSRAADLAALVRHFVERIEAAPVDDRSSAWEITTTLEVKAAARVIGLPKALHNPVGNRHHWSDEQLEYVEGLLRDVPAALRLALARDRRQ